MYIFFNYLNGQNDSPDPEGENINFSIDNADAILNSLITENEILKYF